MTGPSRVGVTLPGLKSRLTCAASSASAICRAMASASATGNPRSVFFSVVFVAFVVFVGFRGFVICVVTLDSSLELA
ncbi:MAG: hypothetical protein DMF96_15340 [Acidobacteria bacterium]|nr:MAG: hypothetical protein DMF96_15340 [Acidobacteriota bacterium]